MRKFLTRLLVNAMGLALTATVFGQVPASQKVIVVEPGEGTLETAINYDVDGNGVRINPNRVYQLKAGGVYSMLAPIIFGSAETDNTATLIIEGETGGKLPIIYQDPLNGGNAFANSVNGGLRLKNIFFQVTAQNGSCNELFRQNNIDPKFYAENVIVEGERTNDLFCFGGTGKLVAYLKSCYFRDNTQFQNPWNFAIFSPGNNVLIDTLWVENCTVANSGLTFFGKTDPVKFCFFDHNTIINVPKYVFFFDEFLEGYFTNNMFINCQWQGECSQMMVSQLGFQIKWGPLAAGVLNQVKEFDEGTWSSRFGRVPEMNEVKYLASNNLQFTSPFLDKYYAGGYGDKDINGNTGPISNIDWGFSPKPNLPEMVVNVPPMFTSKMLDSLAAKYPASTETGIGFRIETPVKSDPKMVTTPIADQAEGDLYAQWARNNFSVPDITMPSADDIKAHFAFGDQDPTTFPGHKTEDGDGVTSVQDFIEDFSYTADIKSTIDSKHLGSLQWFPSELATYNGANALEYAKCQLKGISCSTDVKKATTDLSVKIYPNPTTGKLTIENPANGSCNISVVDLSGKTILKNSNLEGKTNIDLTGYSKGIYLVKVVSANQSYTRTVVLK